MLPVGLPQQYRSSHGSSTGAVMDVFERFLVSAFPSEFLAPFGRMPRPTTLGFMGRTRDEQHMPFWRSGTDLILLVLVIPKHYEHEVLLARPGGFRPDGQTGRKNCVRSTS